MNWKQRTLFVVLAIVGVMLTIGICEANDYSKNYHRVNGVYTNKDGGSLDFQWISKKIFVGGRYEGNKVSIPIMKLKKIVNLGKFKTSLTAAHYNLRVTNVAGKTFELTEAYVYSHKDNYGDWSLKFIYYNDITMDDRVFKLHRSSFIECDTITLDHHFRIQG